MKDKVYVITNNETYNLESQFALWYLDNMTIVECSNDSYVLSYSNERSKL